MLHHCVWLLDILYGHWFNTMMRVRGVPDSLLRSVTGHRTEEMTEMYTSYDLEHYEEVKKAQKALF